MDLAAPDDTASASAEASAFQNSAIGAEFISFQGSANASAMVTGEAAPGSFVVASAGSFIEVVFDVDRAVPSVLTVQTMPTLAGASFGFKLSRDGTVLWNVIERVDPGTGQPIPAFAVPLELLPGHYRFRAEMGAGIATTHYGSSQSFGAVSLRTLIPEPQTWLLTAAGIVVLGIAARRSGRRTCGPLPGGNWLDQFNAVPQARRELLARS
jgi:hypothetical protein